MTELSARERGAAFALAAVLVKVFAVPPEICEALIAEQLATERSHPCPRCDETSADWTVCQRETCEKRAPSCNVCLKPIMPEEQELPAGFTRCMICRRVVCHRCTQRCSKCRIGQRVCHDHGDEMKNCGSCDRLCCAKHSRPCTAPDCTRIICSGFIFILPWTSACERVCSCGGEAERKRKRDEE